MFPLPHALRCGRAERRRSPLWTLPSVPSAPLLVLALATGAPVEAEAGDRPEEIVVTASPLERSADELAAPVRVLTRDELVDQAGSTLGESLRSEPGVTASSFTAGASRPVIRGQDQLRVRVLENGVGTGDLSAISPDHGVAINPLATQRVEVVRGPATLRYGGGAIAGVVNAITSRIPTAPAGRPLAAELYSAYGTGSRQRNLAGLAEGDMGPVSWHVDLLNLDSRDFDIPGSPGTQPNTFTDGYAFSGGAAWIGERLRIGGSITRNRNDYGIPAPEDPAAPSSISLEQDHYAFELDASPRSEWLEQIRVRGAFTEYVHDEVVRGEGITSSFDNEDLEIRAEAVHAELGGFEGALGAQVQTVRFAATGEGGELLPPSKTERVGLYLFESRALTDRLDLELGARLERVRIDGTDLAGNDAARSFNPASASLSLLYGLSDIWGLGLTVSSAQRAPDALELFSQGPHDATETFELGDPDHDEETSRTVDLSLRGESGRLSLQLNLFYTDYSNFTFGRFTGSSRDEDGTRFSDPDSGELRDLVYTQDDATFKGAEAKLGFDLLELGDGVVSLGVQGDFVRARLSSGDVPRIPPYRWGAELAYASSRLSARIGFLRAGAQRDLADFESRTSGYTTVDGSIRLQLAGTAERPIDLTLSVRNLTNERGRNHVSFKKENVLLPGRDIRVGVHMRF